MSITAKIVRSTFLDFFKKNDHTIVPSSSLIPHNDPTMMFVNSGMVQFKNIFTGIESSEYKRATSCQKAVRAGGKHNDLENVGYTARHHTFFEMLGNFSFGDYFKEHAIDYAWRLLTEEFLIPKDRLYVTIYHTDEEAELLWKKIANLSSDRIIKITTNDNFWSMGERGPCGPCSEIFYDHGSHIPGGLPGTPEEDGDRFIEIWNMVFMQYEQRDENTRIDLPHRSIDTGMGLERVCAVLQNVHDNYDIDIFKEIIAESEDLTRTKAIGQQAFSHRIIADHLRSSSFLIADGVMPSNEGRGYVLRRIMRRAMRHIRSLGIKEPVLYNMLPKLVDLMGDAYPELKRSEIFVKEVLKSEEEKFIGALDRGFKLLEEETAALKDGGILSGSAAFKLYDTYGFPLDLTQDILKERKISVDTASFASLMQEQKDRARSAWSGSGEMKFEDMWFNIKDKYGTTEFLGYIHTSSEAIIHTIVKNGLELSEAEGSEEIIIIANQTPFYGESGGQLGDIGIITAEGVKIKVTDTKKYLGSIIGHVCKIEYGRISVGQNIAMSIDVVHRAKLRRYHSATHLLHKALREILGDHITQKGSLVAYDKLRFDISHIRPITKDELFAIEKRVNDMILANGEVHTKLMNTEDAVNSGAMALFGEKYDNEVRVVYMSSGSSEDVFSVELCGGTHVARLGDIGLFKITSEAAISSGVRRIEAICGIDALYMLNNLQAKMDDIATTLKVAKSDIVAKVSDIIETKKNLENMLIQAKEKEFTVSKEEVENNAISVDPFLLYTKVSDMVDIKTQRLVASKIASQIPNLIFIFLACQGDKVSIVSSCGTTAREIVSAADIVKYSSNLLGSSGGGGSKELAQSGGSTLVPKEEFTAKILEFLSSYRSI